MSGGVVLVLGSGPTATRAADWPRAPFTQIVAINNAWQVRPDWDFLIHPDDFPAAQQPAGLAPDQRAIRSDAYVPIQNTYGGFVYAGGTMSFTAGYWALGALKPRVLAYYACDMVYPATGPTHFYGTGTADPLRPDISLRNLGAKSARLMLLAAGQGCACVNLSQDESRLVFPRATLETLADQRPMTSPSLAAALAEEERLGYRVTSGKYWKEEARFDPVAIDALDTLWSTTLDAAQP